MHKQVVRGALKSAVARLPAVAREPVFDFVRRVSKASVSVLPEVAREGVIEQICGEFGRFALMSRLARECGVVALKVSGKYGVIQSSPDDRVVLKEYARTGQWAERTNNLLQSFFAHRDGSYIDIGANIGLTTIPVAQNPRVRCLAVEPEPVNFINLCINIAENCPYKNVEVLPGAIFVRRQTLQFELSLGNLGDHRLRFGESTGQLGEHKRATIDVEAVPLDEIAEGLNGPLAVKIDTQGAEPFVVSGGKRTLARSALIVCEFWPYAMARVGGNPENVIDFLRDQFSSLSIAMQEEGPILPPRPAAEVCAQLTSLVAAHSDNPHMYVDVIAQR
jgi:FkbM family methyltransferase